MRASLRNISRKSDLHARTGKMRLITTMRCKPGRPRARARRISAIPPLARCLTISYLPRRIRSPMSAPARSVVAAAAAAAARRAAFHPPAAASLVDPAVAGLRRSIAAHRLVVAAAADVMALRGIAGEGDAGGHRLRLVPGGERDAVVEALPDAVVVLHQAGAAAAARAFALAPVGGRAVAVAPPGGALERAVGVAQRVRRCAAGGAAQRRTREHRVETVPVGAGGREADRGPG